MVRYNDIVTFITSTINFVDGSPIETKSSIDVKCDVQPSSNNYLRSTNGDLQQTRFDVFIPLNTDISTIKKSKLAEYQGRKYAVVGFYEKQKFNHEFILADE